jgi:P-type E1-E2 ATPase
VRATIDGRSALAGSPRFLAENGIALDGLRARITALEGAGRTVIVVAHGECLLGLLAFGDRLRDGAREVVAALRRAGVRSLLVTGDNRAAAERVAEEAGIEEVHAGLLPHQKAALVRELQRAGSVAMVGDGINDAPALMQANVGIAMGGGTDIAIDAADIIILSDRLDTIVAAREVSRWSYRKMVQNVCLAVMFNGIGVPLAATGLVYPIWGLAAMAVSVTAIFFNSLHGRARLFFDAILSVGRIPPSLARQAV